MARFRLGWRVALVGALLASSAVPLEAAPASAVVLPSGFQEQIVFSGLDQPTNLEFAPDGRVFVAEKRGVIKVYDNLADTTPTVVADLQAVVHNQWDRGLLGLALPPTFPASPYLYVLYTYGVPLAGGPVMDDSCTGASGGANGGNCVVSGRLSRLQITGNVMTGTEQVLINDWCQQFPSHSIGDLQFGPDGMLYLSAGDGASFNAVDFGNFGSPANPCGDPANEGGATRAQDIRTGADATSLDGAVLRLDPATGAAAAGNPLIASADLNTRRVVAHGLRNPYRLTFRPGTSEVWVGDVGWNTWEEINRVVNPLAATPANFGWPCYEGSGRNGSYDAANLPICENMYNPTDSNHTGPYFTYNHSADIVPGEGCTAGGDAVSGLAFYPGSGGSYPAQYAGALFFADYSRNCIWAMKPQTAGTLPSTGNIEIFAKAASGPVDLSVGPGGELYYADLGGTVRRIRYYPGNQPPTAVIGATPTSGSAPLTVAFTGAGSTDADPADQGRLTYAWDFTGDGTTDSTAAAPSFTYAAAGSYTAKLTVTDTLGVANTATVTIQAGNDSPTATIDTPATGFTWAVGDPITFTGHATDPQQGALPASALTWRLRMRHCETVGNCHTHYLQDWTGVAGGSFVAPDHEYPSYLELELDAVDAQNLHSVVVRRLDPKTVDLTFVTSPPGLTLAVGPTTGVTPFTRTVIQGSSNSVSAPTPQMVGITTYSYGSWSDGGAQTHVVTAPSTATTYTASYTGSTPACGDTFGYVCSTAPFTWTAATTPVTLTGDDAYTTVALPFPVPFYGSAYSTAWIDTNGVLSFQAPTGGSSWNHGAIPSALADNVPNLSVYPFWVDLIADTNSGFYTRAAGTAPNRTFTVEWRNLRLYADYFSRVSFQVVLSENGTITTGYADIDPAVALEKGSTATVGIENGAGTVATVYSYLEQKLNNANGVVFTPPGTTPPPPPGTISGTVRNAATNAVIAGATVALTGTSLVTTTAVDGTYTLAGVAPGTYTVAVTAAGFTGTGVSATVTSNATTTANAALSAAPTSGGYSYAEGPVTFDPGTDKLALSGDDAYKSVALPFPVPFYGAAYSTAWIDTNGVLTFQAPNGSSWNHGAIPSVADVNKPNLAAYPFWHDLVVDSLGGGGIYTKTVGSAPNRRYVVEWRNVYVYADYWQRVTFEVILSENGQVTFAYADIDPTKPLERGSGATIGLENANGTVALQYSLNQPVLTSGRGIVFTPGS